MALKTWKGGQAKSFWSNHINWDAKNLPTDGDDIAIGSGFKTIFDGESLKKGNFLKVVKLNSKSAIEISSGTLAATSTFNVDNNLTLSNGVLQLDGASTVTTFTQTGGTLQGSGTLTVTSTAEWTGGTQQGTGTTEINGLLTLNGFDKYLGAYGSPQARTLNINGGANWINDNNYYLYVYGGSTINNRVGSTFNIINDGTGYAGIYGNGTTETFNNAGTLIKSGGGDNFTISTILNNSGTVTVNNGTLTLSKGGEHSGVFNGSGLLIFAGRTHNLNSGTQLTTSNIQVSDGVVNIKAEPVISAAAPILLRNLIVAQGASFNTGQLNISNGTFDLADGAITATPQSGTQSGGTIAGAGKILIANSFNWTGGTQQGTGTTEINGLLTLNGFDKYLGAYGSPQARTLNINGGANWINDNNYYLYIYGGSTINNRVGSTFNIINDGTGYAGIYGNGTTETFNNAGTFIKSGGGDNFTISTILNNSGTVTVNNGTLTLSKGGEHSGVFNGSGLLIFAGRTHNLNSGTQLTTSNIQVSDGVVNIKAGASYLSSSTNITSGNLIVAQGASFNTGQLNISNGTFDLADGAITATPQSGTQSGGTIAGAGKILIANSFNWTGGTQQGTGTTEINGLLTLNGFDKYLGAYGSPQARTLNINGGANWINDNNYYLYIYGGSTINNRVGSTFNIINDGTGYAGIYGNGTTETFNNAGTFIKSGGGDNFTISTILNNSGTVTVNNGTLTLSKGGEHSGVFNGSGLLIFAGRTHNLNSGTQLTTSNIQVSDGVVNIKAGASYLSSSTNITSGNLIVAQGASFNTGQLNISNGTFDLADGAITATPQSGTQSGGTIAGAGKILIANSFNWTGGTQQGTGTTEINGLLTLNGFDKYLGAYGSPQARTLNINGGANWINDNNYYLYIYGGSTINNRVGSTFNIINDGTGYAGIYGNGTTETFNNAGTFIKSGGGDNFTISTILNNSGQIEIQSGRLTFNQNYTQTLGDIRLNGGSIAVGSSSTFKIDGGTISGFGTITGQVNNNAGTLTAGLYVGDFRTLNIIGNYTETNASTINIEIGSLTNFDKLNVSGTGYFDGTVNVSVAQGYTPTLGDSFDIITYSSAPNIANNLAFSGLNLGNNLALKPVFKSNSLSLSVVEAPTLSINDVSVAEGDNGTTALTFSVSLKGNTNAFSVDFATADGTATLFNKDYTATTGTLSFAGISGEIKTITVNVKGDTQIEPEQNLLVNLSNLSTQNVSLIDSQGVGTILNDDTKEVINGTSEQDILNGSNESELITGFDGFDTLMSLGGNDEFVYNKLTNSPDMILDFELGRDTINILDVLKNNTDFVPGTQDPITLGYVKVNSFFTNNYVYIDSDGAAGQNSNLSLLAIVQGPNVNSTTLSNADNFVYSI